jgi:hypothetical protein
MATIEFFKQQSKNFMKDYKTRAFNEAEGFYEYSPRYFQDIDELLYNFGFKDDEAFTLMNAQHIIARLSGFYKWNELIQASEAALEIGKLLLTNREAYQQKQGIFTNMVESLIVADWKEYESQHLQDFDDEAKLEVFKMVILEEGASQKRKAPVITIDFSKETAAQDMLSKIMKKKNLTPEKALLSTITQKNCVKILATGWAGMAVSLWGHADPDGERENLEDPIVKIKLSKDKERLISIVMEKENVSFGEALLYFMIFTLESLGYHI